MCAGWRVLLWVSAERVFTMNGGCAAVANVWELDKRMYSLTPACSAPLSLSLSLPLFCICVGGVTARCFRTIHSTS